MAKRLIFHVDVNSAFLSWEAVERLAAGERVDLREIPSAVCGDRKARHGVILAKSIPAKNYGVSTGEPVTDALHKCPTLLLVPPHHHMYREKSKAFLAILQQYSDVIEQVSVDEAFVDMTGTGLLFGPPEEAANRIRRQVKHELGFTVNIGISSCKILAKMASDFEKPDRVHTLFQEEIPQKMWPLPVRELFFVGEAAEKQLVSLGIRTIGELANAEPQILAGTLKKQGEVLWRYANGIDDAAVEPEAADAKGYGNSTTVAFDITEEETAKEVLLSLSDQVGRRLRRDGVKVESVTVQIRFNDLTRASHQRPLPAATNITGEIYDSACALFDELWDGTPIRLLGVSTKVSRGESGRQMSLFDDTDYEKLERLDKAMDTIRDKFGPGAVLRASGLAAKKEEDDRERNKNNGDDTRSHF